MDMGKTKAKAKAKSKVIVTKAASKPVKKVSKPEKPSAKAAKSVKAVASKAKSDKAPVKAKDAKVMPAAAKAKLEPKKGKAAKKETKSKKEEMDLFDDGEIVESEELLEYEKDLELSEDEGVETEEADSADSSDEDGADPTTAAPAEGDEDVFLTDAEGNPYCRAKDCDQIAAVDGYCRYHYLLLWKRIQIRKEILQDGKLEKYVEDLTSRYPDKFLEMLRKDLRTTKDFMAAIAELEIDESSGEGDFEEDAQTYIDEVRGLSDAASAATMEDDEF